jgi:Amidohydrolase
VQVRQRRPPPLIRLAGVALLLLGSLAHASQTAASAQVQPSDSDLPIFDMHIHYNREAWGLYSVDEALGLLDQAGVRKAFVSSTPDEGTLMLYQRAPDRIVPSLRMYRTSGDAATWTRDASLLPEIDERLQTTIPYRGIGEFHLFSGQSESVVPRAIVAIAADRKLILHAHADAAAVEELLRARPDITVLWAHAGLTEPPETVRRVLDAHPNVWVELAIRTDVAPGGRLDPRWRSLFEAYPDRFMIGTDTWIPSQWTRLPSLMGEVRSWLRQLPPDRAAAIAFSNAERLLTPASD